MVFAASSRRPALKIEILNTIFMAVSAKLRELAEDSIVSKIYKVRDQKVMIDRDLAELYGVETKRLKEAVRRNMDRFPPDFMFEMNIREFENWRTQFASSKDDRQGLRYAPFCFTEQGVTMVSCILNSARAILVNIQVIRVFTKMRGILLTNKDILLRLELINPSQAQRVPIGFRRQNQSGRSVHLLCFLLD